MNVTCGLFPRFISRRSVYQPCKDTSGPADLNLDLTDGDIKGGNIYLGRRTVSKVKTVNFNHLDVLQPSAAESLSALP